MRLLDDVRLIESEIVEMKLIYVWTRMNGQGSPELALENRKNKSWKNAKMHFFYIPGSDKCNN